MDRLEEILDLRSEDGRLDRDKLMPAILVSAQPRYEESQAWFAVRVIEALQRALGEEGLRLCEACMAPRAFMAESTMVYSTGAISLDEIIRLDTASRGEAPPARTAIWVDEYSGGVSLRMVDLRTGRVVFAQNIDPRLIEHSNTQRMYTLTAELERRARGDGLTQGFVDAALLPNQHISIDWTDQWGKNNGMLTGLTLTITDPRGGFGLSHYVRTPLNNTLVGAKGVVSLPTLIAQTFNPGAQVFDPLLNVIGVVRVPFGRSNYGAIATVSTNGNFGFGLSLMNISLLPFVP